ncbi:MAG: MscL family protein [Aeriscardovia sp.]|nr:MscL family protein [Aeriscardovia sp.]
MTSYQTSSFHGLGLFSGFKKFISRSSIIDMAIGVVMGTAISSVVSTFVSSVVNPLIAMIFRKKDMSDILTFSYAGATVSLGAVLNALIQFLTIALAIYFLVIVPVNKMHDVSEKLAKSKYRSEELNAIEQAAQSQGTDSDEQIITLLTQIKEELKKGERPVTISDLVEEGFKKNIPSSQKKNQSGEEAEDI